MYKLHYKKLQNEKKLRENVKTAEIWTIQNRPEHN